jgi:hypothetical protein
MESLAALFINKTYVHYLLMMSSRDAREYRWDNGKMDNPEKLIKYRVHKRWKQKHNTICDGRHYAQTNTNNVNKT